MSRVKDVSPVSEMNVLERMQHGAEARGYQRGVREAVAAGDMHAKLCGDSWKAFCRKAILALLDPSLSPEDKP
jgi:hypothetical protein